ncbi:hypothetical protein CLV88_104248 [Shimia abyssi]|uniref:Lipoprotein n=1 Tax=Shimia abyssi TaxID=1662395 RepID=A0A2P8FEP4_9RHOB|nr:hypothetical protein CLV88_104248 [Shimia abyssi]
MRKAFVMALLGFSTLFVAACGQNESLPVRTTPQAADPVSPPSSIN